MRVKYSDNINPCQNNNDCCVRCVVLISNGKYNGSLKFVVLRNKLMHVNKISETNVMNVRRLSI